MKKWLYLIVDFSYGKDKIQEALLAGVDLIQLREKQISSAEYLRRAKLLVEMAKPTKTKVIINDRADIALLSQADGVHLGASDLPVDEARKLLGEGKMIGATARTPYQAREAWKMGADYLGSGAWFVTHTKDDAVPITPERYRKIRRAAPVPNVAVGGITPENAYLPLRNGCDGLAVSAGIMQSDDIRKTIENFRGQLEET